MQLDQLYTSFDTLSDVEKVSFIRLYRDKRVRDLTGYNKDTAGKEIKVKKAKAKQRISIKPTAREIELLAKFGYTKGIKQ